MYFTLEYVLNFPVSVELRFQEADFKDMDSG